MHAWYVLLSAYKIMLSRCGAHTKNGSIYEVFFVFLFSFVLFFKSCFASIELTIFALTSLQLASTPLRWRTYLRFFACVRPSHPIDSEQCEHECIRTSGHPLVRGTNVNCF